MRKCVGDFYADANDHLELRMEKKYEHAYDGLLQIHWEIENTISW